jgi:Ras GTPase-activating-like protein IQGAP2/3
MASVSVLNGSPRVADDPLAASKADWVQAKRHILATLRVQSGKTLIDLLTRRVSDNEEWVWEEVVERDVARERARKHRSALPPIPTAGGTDYGLEDIRS